jgi:hypothetical protein
MQDERSLTLRQLDQARTDLALLADDLDFLKGQLAAIPTRKEIWRLALLAMLSGSALTISVAMAFWHPCSGPDSSLPSSRLSQRRWPLESIDPER